MKYHLFQFKDSPNFNKSVHDLLNIYFKKDPDFIYYYDKTLEDAYQFIEDNLNDSDKCLVLYCQSEIGLAENDRELLIYLQKYNDQKIKLKILFFSFDWWCNDRCLENWLIYVQTLFKAKNHYVVTFANDLDNLERIHGLPYGDYKSNIIFYNFWSCYDGSFVDFNYAPIEKIAVCGTINFAYYERIIIRDKVRKSNDSKFSILQHDWSEINSDANGFTKRLNSYLCCFSSCVYDINSVGELFHRIKQQTLQHKNTHLIPQKIYEILASGSLLLCPKTEEEYLNKMGLFSNINCLIWDIHDIDHITEYILDKNNREHIDKMRMCGYNFALENLTSEHKYNELKNILDNRLQS